MSRNMNHDLPDPHFRLQVVTKTPDPQQAIYIAMHQDYSEGFALEEFLADPISEKRCGEIAVKRLLNGERGHYGPLEHPQITFNVGGFPHSVMQQARTHRIGTSFDVQSLRYTGERFIRCAAGELGVEDVFYLRPVGAYANRQGRHFAYTSDMRLEDIDLCLAAAQRYAYCVEQGMAEEQARGTIPFDFRQNFVVSFSLRAALHFIDMRLKKDAQEEIRWMCALMQFHLCDWVPEIWAYYQEHRLGKARLAP